MSRWVATVEGQPTPVEVTGRDGRYRIVIGERTLEVDARRTADGQYSLLIDGVSHVADVAAAERGTRVDIDGSTYVVEVEEHTRHALRTRGAAGGHAAAQTVKAPLPGKVTHVAVAPGDRVERGDTLVVIEAMKMENEFRALSAGTVTDVRVQAGRSVNAGDVLIVIG